MSSVSNNHRHRLITSPLQSSVYIIISIVLLSVMGYAAFKCPEDDVIHFYTHTHRTENCIWNIVSSQLYDLWLSRAVAVSTDPQNRTDKADATVSRKWNFVITPTEPGISPAPEGPVETPFPLVVHFRREPPTGEWILVEHRGKGHHFKQGIWEEWVLVMEASKDSSKTCYARDNAWVQRGRFLLLTFDLWILF